MTPDVDEPLRGPGMKALMAERAKARKLRAELHNLRAAVISATNVLVDVVEQDGGQRHGR